MKTKLIIFEGADGIGKTTLIKKFIDCNDIDNYVLRHFKPQINITNVFDSKGFNYKDYFMKMFWNELDFLSFIFNKKFDNNLDYVIWDRSHLSDYVYGNLYRGYNTKDFIFEYENRMKDVLKSNFDNVYLIVLSTNNPKILLKKEENLINKNLDLISEEIRLYKKVYNLSKIKNKIVLNNFSLIEDDFIDDKAIIGFINSFVKDVDYVN